MNIEELKSVRLDVEKGVLEVNGQELKETSAHTSGNITKIGETIWN